MCSLDSFFMKALYKKGVKGQILNFQHLPLTGAIF